MVVGTALMSLHSGILNEFYQPHNWANGQQGSGVLEETQHTVEPPFSNHMVYAPQQAL